LKTIKAIEPLPLAKMAGIIGAVWGLVVAVAVMMFQAGFSQYMGRFYTVFSIVFPHGGALDLITLPIFYALVGFVGAYLGAWFYNLLSKQIGGVKIDLK